MFSDDGADNMYRIDAIGRCCLPDLAEKGGLAVQEINRLAELFLVGCVESLGPDRRGLWYFRLLGGAISGRNDSHLLRDGVRRKAGQRHDDGGCAGDLRKQAHATFSVTWIYRGCRSFLGRPSMHGKFAAAHIPVVGHCEGCRTTWR